MRYLAVWCCAGLVLCGVQAAAEEAPPSKSITLEIILAEASEAEAKAAAASAAAVLEMELAGKLTYFARFRLTGLENQKVSIKFGELTPVATGWTVSTVGRTSPNYTTMPFGSEVTTVSRVQSDGAVVTDLKVVRSVISPPQPPDFGDPNAKFQGAATFNWEASVRSKPGEPLLVAGRQHRSGKETAQTWIVLTSSVAAAPPLPAAPAPTSARKAAQVEFSPQVIRAHVLRSAAAKQMAARIQASGQQLTTTSNPRLNGPPIPAAPARRPAVSAVLTTLDANK